MKAQGLRSHREEGPSRGPPAGGYPGEGCWGTGDPPRWAQSSVCDWVCGSLGPPPTCPASPPPGTRACPMQASPFHCLPRSLHTSPIWKTSSATKRWLPRPPRVRPVPRALPSSGFLLEPRLLPRPQDCSSAAPEPPLSPLTVHVWSGPTPRSPRGWATMMVWPWAWPSFGAPSLDPTAPQRPATWDPLGAPCRLLGQPSLMATTLPPA